MKSILKFFLIIFFLSGFMLVYDLSYGEESLISTNHYSYDISVAPSNDKDDVFLCKVMIKDLDTDKILYNPEVITSSGKEAKIQIGDDWNKGEKIVIIFLVDKDKLSANYSVEIFNKGKLTGSFTGIVIF
ncbi:MAG TPA: hypothetical protein PL110_19215 [Candidatus Eremiobacteraeota bacterium]|nr:MAG: hypothetical protein BWY64_01887 [bacterium ADurb.Bin363]HPZ10229.1 hypothetical protein [Candidatus Eremiobacteraeota bacterium]